MPVGFIVTLHNVEADRLFSSRIARWGPTEVKCGIVLVLNCVNPGAAWTTWVNNTFTNPLALNAHIAPLSTDHIA